VKQSVSPAIAAILVVVAVLIVGFIGYKVVGGKGTGQSSGSTQDAKSKMEQYQQSIEQHGAASAGKTGRR